MKKLLSTTLAILMVVSVFLMTGCMKEEDYYTKGDVDGFVTNLQNEIASKNDAALAEISGLKAIYEAKIALLDKEDEDLKAELKNLTDAYNAKVKELEAADKATADALAAHKTAYETELAKLQTADTENKAAIEALTTAYNAKVAELNNKITENKNALNAHKTAYEAKVAEINGKISANETAISNLETELEAKINQVKADTEREIGEINTLITQLQNADTTNANAIKALSDAYNAKVSELDEKNKEYEKNLKETQEALKALTDAYNSKIDELEGELDELLSKHEHSFGAWTPVDCTSTLYFRSCSGCEELSWKKDTPVGHKYKMEYDYDSHWGTCEVCEYKIQPEPHIDDGTGECSVCDDIVPSAGLEYTVASNGTYATVTGYSGTATKLKIAGTYNGLPVTSIGDEAFRNCSRLTSITIPDSVTRIGDLAFYNCSGLTSITIPDSVTRIGDLAFYNCSGLTSITIPDSVTSIGYDYAFYGCSGLTSITVAAGNTKYHSAGNCLIETARKTLILGCKNSVIPTDGSVTSIGDGAFSGCSGLTSITIPDSVTSIDDYAFSGCSGLTSVTFENPNGWWYSSSWLATSGTGISSSDLSDTSTAAEYLTDTYYDYYWKRS